MSLAQIECSTPDGDMAVSYECCTGTSVWDGLIPRPGSPTEDVCV